MANKKPKKNGNEPKTAIITLITAILTMLSNIIALIIKLTELFNA